jgi:hypothetical protein
MTTVEAIQEFEASHHGHFNVQEHQIGRKGGNFRQRCRAVICFGDNFYTVQTDELLPQNLAGNGFIVYDQNAQRQVVNIGSFWHNALPINGR